MPTNVTAEYAKAERDYQQASTAIEKLKTLEVMLKEVPKHKGTEALRAEIKTKISKLKEKLLKERESKKRGFSLAVKKEGAAQIVFVGPPNTGKTTILNLLSNSTYQTAPYPHTTAKPQIGTLDYETVKLQLVDLPPLIEDAALKQAPYFAIIRNADLALLIVESLEQIPRLLKEFSDSHILLNKPRPPIVIKRSGTGGLTFVGDKFIQTSMEEVKKVLREHNIANATVEIFSPVQLDDFFEVLDEKLAYLPAIIVINKQDTEKKPTKKGKFDIIPFSAIKQHNLQILKDKIWEKLNLIRVRTKEPGKKPSTKEPITLPKGSCIKDMAQYIHKDFLKKFNYARVWGTSTKHDSANVGLDHQLHDKDVVEIHLK